MNNRDLFGVARFTRSTFIEDGFAMLQHDYRRTLIARNKRWRQACIDRGLDPEHELEHEIRRSIHRNQNRSAVFSPPKSWLRRQLDRLR